MEKDCRTANQPARNWERDDDIPTRSRATLPFSSSLASRSTSSPPVSPPEPLSATTIHLPPSPTPPPRRSRATPTLRSSRLKFSYRHVYRSSLCLEQVKCTATVAPFSTSFRHCHAAQIAGRPPRHFSSFTTFNQSKLSGFFFHLVKERLERNERLDPSRGR